MQLLHLVRVTTRQPQQKCDGEKRRGGFISALVCSYIFEKLYNSCFMKKVLILGFRVFYLLDSLDLMLGNFTLYRLFFQTILVETQKVYMQWKI